MAIAKRATPYNSVNKATFIIVITISLDISNLESSTPKAAWGEVLPTKAVRSLVRPYRPLDLAHSSKVAMSAALTILEAGALCIHLVIIILASADL